MNDHQRVSAQTSLGETMMGKRWNDGQGQTRAEATANVLVNGQA
jgi:hypothetical protein